MNANIILSMNSNFNKKICLQTNDTQVVIAINIHQWDVTYTKTNDYLFTTKYIYYTYTHTQSAFLGTLATGDGYTKLILIHKYDMV